MSKIQGEESEIDLSLAEEKLKVQQAATVTHQKGERAEDRGARTRAATTRKALSRNSRNISCR